MPGYKAIVDAVSADVVVGLATGGWPALQRGKILIGRQYQFEQAAPPRIIFVPTTNRFDVGKSVYDASSASSLPGMNPNQRRQKAFTSIQTDVKTFEVRCWGIAPNKDPDTTYDYTEALYQQVIRSIHAVATGSYVLGRGEWTDGKIEESQLIRYGREFVFEVELETPITRYPVPLQYGPPGTVIQETVILDQGGILETGAVIRT